jgi:hypothetical protein
MIFHADFRSVAGLAPRPRRRASYGVTHTPLMHTGLMIGPHTCPQVPQLLLSLLRLTQPPGHSVSPGGQSVVDVVVPSGAVDEVLVDDGGVVVVGGGQCPVRSQASPEQHSVPAVHGSPVRVQQPHVPSDSGSQRSYWMGHSPPQLSDPHSCSSGTHEHVWPLGEPSRHAIPAGQLPPQTPAPVVPLDANAHGMVVVELPVVTVVVVGGAVVVVLVLVVVLSQTASAKVSMPAWNAASSSRSPPPSAAWMRLVSPNTRFPQSWLGKSDWHVGPMPSIVTS